MRATSELTRRRDRDAQQETRLIYYSDVRVGVIAESVGNPDSTPGWQWSCGFYPGSNPSEHARGIAKSFEQACGAFEIAWRHFSVKRTEANFEEYRRCFSRLEAGHVGGRPQAADAGCRRPLSVLLRRYDRAQ
jgi:hypothetical protein